MGAVTLEAYQAAELEELRQQSRRGFVAHGIVTAVVCIVVLAVNLTVADEFPWAVFPIAGMSIGLFLHWYFGVRHGAEELRRHQMAVERLAGSH